MKSCLYLLSALLETAGLLLAAGDLANRQFRIRKYKAINQDKKPAATRPAIRAPEWPAGTPAIDDVPELIARGVNEGIAKLGQVSGSLLYEAQDIGSERMDQLEKALQVQASFPWVASVGAGLLLAGVWVGYAANIIHS